MQPASSSPVRLPGHVPLDATDDGENRAPVRSEEGDESTVAYPAGGLISLRGASSASAISRAPGERPPLHYK